MTNDRGLSSTRYFLPMFAWIQLPYFHTPVKFFESGMFQVKILCLWCLLSPPCSSQITSVFNQNSRVTSLCYLWCYCDSCSFSAHDQNITFDLLYVFPLLHRYLLAIESTGARLPIEIPAMCFSRFLLFVVHISPANYLKTFLTASR